MELLVVVVILGIASAVVIPMIGDNGDLRVTAAARQVVSDLLYAQTCSISSQSQYQVVFDAANNSYEIQDATGSVISNPLTKASYQMNLSVNNGYKNVTVESANFDDNNRIWFDKMGMPYSGAIADNNMLVDGSIYLKSANATMTVNIEPISGRINITQ